MPKNYCNRTLAVKVIVENVVACFSGTQCIYNLLWVCCFETQQRKATALFTTRMHCIRPLFSSRYGSYRVHRIVFTMQYDCITAHRLLLF